MIVSGGKGIRFPAQALAERVPVSQSTGYFYARDGVTLTDHHAAYGALYRAQPALSTLIDKVSNAAARLSFKTWKGSLDSDEKERDTSSAWAKLWREPCPVMSTYSFWRWTMSTYELYGEAFWYKQRVNGQVVGLLPMHPSRTQVRRDVDGNVTYVFSLGVSATGILEAPASDVVAFLRYNPEDLMRGLSRVEPLRSTLANEDASRRANESAWRRGARPGLMLSTDAQLSDAALSRLQTQVSSASGGPDAAGSSLILEEGLKPYPIQLTAKEMEYIESRKLNLQEVCMVFDVPPPVVHILDHATFSNITEQMRSMYRDTMAPRLEDVESAIDHQLRPDFDPTGTLSARFALDEVLRGDFETRATAVHSLVQSGVMTPNEARILFDLPTSDNPLADKLFANSAIQELGKPAERVSLSATDAADPAQENEIDGAKDDAKQAEDAAAPEDSSPPVNGGKQNRRRTVRRHARAAERQETE